MSSVEAIRASGRKTISFDSGNVYVIRSVWPVDLYRDGVLPKGAMTGIAPRTIDDDAMARLESSLLCRGIVEPRVFDMNPPDGGDALDVRDIPIDERQKLFEEIISISGLRVTTLPDHATDGERFRDEPATESGPGVD